MGKVVSLEDHRRKTASTSLDQDGIYENQLYGKKEIELAVDGWVYWTNIGHNDTRGLLGSLKNAKLNGNLEAQVENEVYDSDGDRIDGIIAIYVRGEGIKPRVPQAVIKVARDYLSKGEAEQKAYLKNVYHQVVEDGERKGDLATILKYFSDADIAILLNYFADKLEEFGFELESQGLKKKTQDTIMAIRQGKQPDWLT